MCAFDPEKRIKISTVVDKLAQMASDQQDSLKDNLETEQGAPKVAREAITAAQKLLNQLVDAEDRSKPLPALYASLWDRLGHVHDTIDDKHESECQTEFYSLVADADGATQMLQDVSDSLIRLAETTMRYYALNRRLDKFCDAYSLSSCRTRKRQSQVRAFWLGGRACFGIPSGSSSGRSFVYAVELATMQVQFAFLRI